MGKENHVCLLKKSLYGLKQSPRQWYKKFDSFMVSINFSCSNYDSCVYFKKLSSGEFIYLLLYVDDMLITASNMEEIVRLKEQLGSTFEMKDLGAAKSILGMEISRDRPNRKLFLTKGVCRKGNPSFWHGESQDCFHPSCNTFQAFSCYES